MTHALRIGTVRYRNFGPFADVAVDFSQPGLTGIEGLISWKPGSNSNGSGKSFLIDGPAWCLWGRCLREDYKGDDVVRIGSKGGASVETTVVGGEHEIRVVRYRQHPTYKNRVYLYVGGNDVTRGTDVETQAVIDHLLLDFLSSQSSLFFGAREDVRSFFSAPDAVRKQILDQILGLSLYADAEKVARKRASALATELAPLREKRAQIEGALSNQRGMLASLQGTEDVEVLSFRARQALLRERLCAKQLARREAYLQEEQHVLAFEEEQAMSQVAAYRAVKDSYAKARSDMERAVRITTSALASAETVCTRSKQALAKHETASQTCSACGQALPKGKHAEIHEQLRSELTAAQAALATAKQNHTEATAALSALLEPIQPVFPEVDLARECVALEQARYDEAHRLHADAVSNRKHADDLLRRATSQVQQVQTKIAEQEKALAVVIADIGTRERQADLLTFWVEGFGNQGLKSFLIESEIATINKRASGYAQRLLGPGATVQLSATTQLKTSDVQREKLSIVAKVPGCTDTYAGASKGQKRRLDLALLLAFRDLVSERSVGAFRQFFADELFDGLDQTGTEFVVALLREIADRDCPVILVTHNLQLKSAVDRVITVRHEKEYSATVTTSSGKVSVPKAKKKLATG